MADLLPSPEDPLTWWKGLAKFEELSADDGHSIGSPHTCSWCKNIQILEESSTGRTLASNPLLRPQQVLEAAKKGCLFYKWAAACLHTYFRALSSEDLEIQDNEAPFLTLDPEESDDSVDFRASLKSKSEPLGMKGPQIHAWTYESDLAAGLVDRRPPEIKADEKTLGFARSCLQNCLASHNRCRPGYPDSISRSPASTEAFSPKDAPTRLLHMQDKGGELHVRVVDVCHLESEDREHLMQSGYLTLSYCWGKDQPVKLTLGSEPTLRSGIPSSKLPKTLRDAVGVSRSLGRQFIWIDALCILQDSSSDKAVEIANMSRYYSKSTLAICAGSAVNCDGGLFQKQRSTPCHFQFGPIQLEFKAKSGQLGHIYLAGKLVQTQEPLTTRAWTFQETMLSQRMLIFGTNELHWSCKAEHGSHFEGLWPRISGGADTLIPGIDSLEPIRFLPPKHQWPLIVYKYSSRLLGFPADRLPAVSALASVLQDGNGTLYNYSGYQPMVYVAGLFIIPHDSQSWVDALLWRVTAMASATRSQPYRAPSWSWASVDGEVYCLPPRQSDRANDFGVEAYGVTLNNKAAPYGMVDDAFLSIRARCRTLRGPLTMEMAIALENDHDHLAKEYGPYVSNTALGFIVFYPDTLNSRRVIEEAMDGKGAVLLVEVFKLPPSGLVLYPINSQHAPRKSAMYERIGCFVSQSTDWQWKSENMNWGDMEAVFGDAQVQSLRIV